jgi:hypothetical protein
MPIGIIYAMFKQDRGGYWFKMAISFDQLGNVALSRLFNDLLIKPNRDLFGKEDETISSVLGKNKLNGTLKPLGKALVWILDTLDENHSIKSIEVDE